LFEAQQNYSTFGACERRFIENVHPPDDETRRDPNWRPIDPALDSFEEWGTSQNRAPSDGESLYYWRPSFWRRNREA
jgi:hypothetical protein